jgi:hypothetical protein
MGGGGGGRVLAGPGDFYLHHRIQADSRAQSAFYSMGNGEGSFPGGKAADA